MGAVHTRFSTRKTSSPARSSTIAAVARRHRVDAALRQHAPAHPLDVGGGALRETADAGRRVEERGVDRLRQQRVLEQRPEAVRLLPLVDDGAIHAGPGPVAVQLRGRVEQELLGVGLEEDLVERAAVLVDDVGLERLAGELLLLEQVEPRPEHQRERHRQEDARAQRPLVELAEHPHAALARDLVRVLGQDLADEGLDPRVLGVEPVRPDVEVEVAVVPRSGPGRRRRHGSRGR